MTKVHDNDQRFLTMEAKIEELGARIDAFGAACDALRTEFDAWGEGNRSSPDKRPMTKGDARRVLDGDAKELNHKDAAAMVGLTYAQVYSARLEFTFKEVHKDLRELGFKNPWKK
jgi:hypothetical protein